VTELVSYTIVLLRRGARADEYTDEELQSLQEGHVAFLGAQREAGNMLAGGPFREQPDETLRGLCVYRVPVEQARALVAGDPSIAAGRMAADVFEWLMPPGQVTFGP
jgi:uncharacterized protein YciI